MRSVAGGLDRKHLGVLYAIVGVRAAAHNLAFGRNQHSANPWIGRGQGNAAAGKLQGLLHVPRVVGFGGHLQLNSDSTKSLALKGNRSPIFSPTPT